MKLTSSVSPSSDAFRANEAANSAALDMAAEAAVLAAASERRGILFTLVGNPTSFHEKPAMRTCEPIVPSSSSHRTDSGLSSADTSRDTCGA